MVSYRLSLRSQSSKNSWQDRVASLQYWSQGQNVLTQMLDGPLEASSDAIAQAVLMLIALARDFGSREEAQIHICGLKNMINQRGGISQFTHNPFLKRQLKNLATARMYHATLSCEPDCAHPFRFSLQERHSIIL